MKAKCAKQKYDHPAEEKDVKVASPAKEEKKTQVGYSAPYNTSNGRLPTFAGINTSSAVFNTVVNSFGVGTYNFLATTVNDVGNGIGAVYDLANTVSEAVIGMDLDEAAMTMQATGLLAPAGVVLEGVNLWFDTAKMVNGSKGMQTLLSAAQTTVNVGAEALGVESIVKKEIDLPLQVHHFATNKNLRYTPQFEKIVSKYGLKLNDSSKSQYGEWNKELMHHRGRHPNEYHEFVLDGMNRADREAGGNVEKFLQNFNKYIVEHVLSNPEILRKYYWME